MRVEERRYYDRRAPEYDDWYLGRGKYIALDRPGWDEELEALVRLLRSLPPRPTLDVACGTGFLTRHLPGEVVGLDQSEAMLEIARARRRGARFVVGNALDLPFADQTFDLAFTSYFYGHLRAPDRERFLAEARRVARKLLVVDAALRADVEREEIQERVLGDGSRHSVYKRYFEADDLAAELGSGRVLFPGRWHVAVEA